MLLSNSHADSGKVMIQECLHAYHQHSLLSQSLSMTALCMPSFSKDDAAVSEYIERIQIAQECRLY